MKFKFDGSQMVWYLDKRADYAAHSYRLKTIEIVD
jgi:hypothetical protein